MAQQTVLIIDDHQGVRELLVAIASEAGFRAVTAESSVAGINALRKTPCDVVIMDMSPTDMTAEEALNGLLAVKPHIPIFITTDRGVDDEVKGLLARGASLCLEKPFNVAHIERAIKNSIR